jgi:hypothetical protein
VTRPGSIQGTCTAITPPPGTTPPPATDGGSVPPSDGGSVPSDGGAAPPDSGSGYAPDGGFSCALYGQSCASLPCCTGATCIGGICGTIPR